ncbi:MAG: hypothetical protein IIC82_08515, partial [Chloroflexi bacterium]|nr:hypothetical protein [Chloroflexota bacterium]
MESVAVILVLVSSAMHAVWNAVGKRKVPTASFFLVASVGGLLLLLFALPTWPDVTAEFAARDAFLVVLAGFFEAVYLAALAGGYRSGDLSLVYPLARSVPAVTVTVGSVLLGRSSEIGFLCWAGAFLIVIGCVLLPQKSLSNLRLSNYWNSAFLFAMRAALGTTGYSLTDDEALRGLRLAHPDIHPAGVTLVYSFYQIFATGFWLCTFIFFRPRGRASFKIAARDWKFAFPVGGLITLTYVMVLVALAFTRDVSYVVAFRQTSIPMGVLIGVLFFKE